MQGCKGMVWIEGLYFSATYDIIVYGFYMVCINIFDFFNKRVDLQLTTIIFWN